MPVESYIRRQDKCDQSFLVSLVGQLGVPEVFDGMCLMLTINWLIRCTTPAGPSSDLVWRNMKAEGASYFQQIASQQRGYSQNLAKKEPFQDSVENCLSFASSSRLRLGPKSSQAYTNAYLLTDNMALAFRSSNTSPPSCIIMFKWPSGYHCIGAVEDMNARGCTWYIFDPNFGVLTVDISVGQPLISAVQDLFTKYQILWALSVPIMR